MPPWTLALADDLTGALEVGAKFAAHGLKATVTTTQTISSPPVGDVLVIDTETRHLSEAAAYERVHETSINAGRYAPFLIYKKTDSTLRGHIAAELRALQAAFPDRSLVYAPAYVALGRTVKDGCLYVDGTLLHETDFANDLLNPVRESNIPQLLQNPSVLVLDGQSQAEAERAADIIMEGDPLPLAVGPAALAEVLAARLTMTSTPAKTLPPLVRCLVVNGSLHPVSQQQIRNAHAQGCLGDGFVYFDEEITGTGLARARALGERVRQVLHTSRFDGLIVFGGDTAFGIHRAIDAPDFESFSDIVPGVPTSRCGDLFWITKAGGFGPQDLFCQLRSRLLETR